MNKLIIDAARDKIFLMIIDNDMNYNISHKNSKINYERLILLIIEFLNSKNLDLKKISKIYVNRGPGSFAGIRNSLSIVKAIHLVNKIDYFCFSFDDFEEKISEERTKLTDNLSNDFGTKLIVLPNPNYGDWESNGIFEGKSLSDQQKYSTRKSKIKSY